MSRNFYALLFTISGLINSHPACAAEKQEITSLQGEWKAVSYTLDGREYGDFGRREFSTDFFAKNTIFELFANGYGTCKGEKKNEIWWEYNKKTNKFLLKQYNTFAIGTWNEIIEDATAERVDDTIVLEGVRKFSSKPDVVHKIKFILVPTKLAHLVGSSVKLDEKAFDRDFFSEEYKTKPGVPKKISLKRDFESSVTATGTVGTEVGVEAKAGNENVGTISASMKTKIEATLGTTIGTRDTFEESYELDGKEHVKMTVKWVKRYRKGTVELADGTKNSFEVFIGYRTIPEYDE